jgi:cysteinyl-tRNA synthetase
VPDSIKESLRAAGDEADRVLKEVAADGKITEEEQKRVAEAQARYNAELGKGEAAMKQAEKDAEARAKQLEKIAEKEAQIEEERVFQLSKASTTVLKANDVRTAEGASEFLRLATGREDPAIAEYRKQLKELQKMNAELAKIGGAVEIV